MADNESEPDRHPPEVFGVSFVYHLGSVFPRLCPFIATLLFSRLGTGAVASYLAASCLITVIATWFLMETHRVKLDAAVSSPAV
jgi:hypothetical protein